MPEQEQIRFTADCDYCGCRADDCEITTAVSGRSIRYSRGEETVCRDCIQYYYRRLPNGDIVVRDATCKVHSGRGPEDENYFEPHWSLKENALWSNFHDVWLMPFDPEIVVLASGTIVHRKMCVRSGHEVVTTVCGHYDLKKWCEYSERFGWVRHGDIGRGMPFVYAADVRADGSRVMFRAEEVTETVDGQFISDVNNAYRSRWNGQLYWNADRAPEFKAQALNSYSYRPTPVFFGEGEVHFGIENEVDRSYDRQLGTRDLAAMISKHLGMIGYCKSDSSLEDGVEIVSHPITYEGWVRLYPLMDVMFAKVRAAGYVADAEFTQRCGMHIHTPKALYSSLQIFKICELLMGNGARGAAFVRALSGRKQSDRTDRYAGVLETYAHYRSKARHMQGGARNAVNVGNDGTRTVEFRMFNGTLDVDVFYKNIDTTRAFMQFGATTSLRDLTPRVFLGMVDDHRHQYPFLSKWLDTQSWVSNYA